eukprot:m.110755 g.110755  ORF g.110755 m.110755 type:complete len:553 (+) comp13406_c0_seq14:148-1806(+)
MDQALAMLDAARQALQDLRQAGRGAQGGDDGDDDGVQRGCISMADIKNELGVWFQLKPTGVVPCPRSGHATCTDGTVLYVYGGFCDPVSTFPKLLRYHILSNTWEELQTTGPNPKLCLSHSMVLAGSHIIVFGGTGFPFGFELSCHLHICDLRTLEWTVHGPPTIESSEDEDEDVLSDSSEVGDSEGDSEGEEVFHWAQGDHVSEESDGGSDGTEEAGEWVGQPFSEEEIQRLDDAIRRGEIVVLDQDAGDAGDAGDVRMEEGSSEVESDGEAQAGEGMEQGADQADEEAAQGIQAHEAEEYEEPQVYPAARFGQSLAFDPRRRVLWMFGGTTGHEFYNDLWCFDLVSQRWEELPEQHQTPSARYRHQTVIVDDKLYLFGGGAPGVVYEVDDVRVFDLKTKVWYSLPILPIHVPEGQLPPPALACPRLVCHAITEHDGVVYILGGKSGMGPNNDMWALNLRLEAPQWQLIACDQPQTTWFHTLTATPHGALFCFAGVKPVHGNEQRTNKVLAMQLTVPTLTQLCLRKLAHPRFEDKWDKLSKSLQHQLAAPY